MNSSSLPTSAVALAQKLHPSYTNFSLVPTTATRSDMEPFLHAEYRNTTKSSNATASKLKKNTKNNQQHKTTRQKRGPSQNSQFPSKLHEVLSDPSLSDVITWMPHGRSWTIRNKSVFVERVGKKHFSQSKFTSFTRQLVSGWGFKRKIVGEDHGSYYHELFLRGMPHLVQYMERVPKKMVMMTQEPKKPMNAGSDNVYEPDFYVISKIFPVPCLDIVTQSQGQEYQTKAKANSVVTTAVTPYKGFIPPRRNNSVLRPSTCTVTPSRELMSKTKSSASTTNHTAPKTQYNEALSVGDLSPPFSLLKQVASIANTPKQFPCQTHPLSGNKRKAVLPLTSTCTESVMGPKQKKVQLLQKALNVSLEAINNTSSEEICSAEERGQGNQQTWGGGSSETETNAADVEHFMTSNDGAAVFAPAREVLSNELDETQKLLFSNLEPIDINVGQLDVARGGDPVQRADAHGDCMLDEWPLLLGLDSSNSSLDGVFDDGFEDCCRH